jgi:hypothetical protein
MTFLVILSEYKKRSAGCYLTPGDWLATSAIEWYEAYAQPEATTAASDCT